MTKQYLDMLEYILKHGEEREDRTGTGTIGVFGYQMRFNLEEGFPLLTTKKMDTLFPKIFHELMWFLKGETNIRYLLDRNVNIWNADAYRWYKHNIKTIRDFAPKEYIHISEKQYIELVKTDDYFAEQYGDLGLIYGKQWTDFGGHEELVPLEYAIGHYKEKVSGINQVEASINLLETDPFSRRNLIVAWNPYDMDNMALPPCHVLTQFYTSNAMKLSNQMYQRSGDAFLGVPFNIPSYSLYTHMVAYLRGMGVGEFIHTFGDLHIYSNHVEQVRTQLTREPLPLPKLIIKPRDTIKSITDFELSDFELVDYESYGKLTGEVSVGK